MTAVNVEQHPIYGRVLVCVHDFQVGDIVLKEETPISCLF